MHASLDQQVLLGLEGVNVGETGAANEEPKGGKGDSPSNVCEWRRAEGAALESKGETRPSESSGGPSHERRERVVRRRNLLIHRLGRQEEHLDFLASGSCLDV